MTRRPSRKPLDRDLYDAVVAEAKRKFDVWPSAYASGWVVKTYKARGGRYAGVDKPAPGESLSAWQARTGRGVRANPLPRSGEELSWTLGPSGLQERDVEDTYITIRRRKATEANEALKDLGFIDEDFFESRGSFLFIEEMAVSSKDRRQGIGRKLVEEALRGAKSPVWVIAAPLGSSEHPEGFYKRLGFEPVLQNRHGQTLMVRR